MLALYAVPLDYASQTHSTLCACCKILQQQNVNLPTVGHGGDNKNFASVHMKALLCHHHCVSLFPTGKLKSTDHDS